MWMNEMFASLFIINPLADVFILRLWRQPCRNQVPQRDNKAWKLALWSLRQGRAETYTTFNFAVFGGGFTAVMMEPAQGSISGWTDGWMEEEKVSNMEQLIVLLAAPWLFCLWTVYHFWQEVTGRPDHRRRARMDENLVLTDTKSLARSHTSLGPHRRRVCAIMGLISALSII